MASMALLPCWSQRPSVFFERDVLQEAASYFKSRACIPCAQWASLLSLTFSHRRSNCAQLKAGQVLSPWASSTSARLSAQIHGGRKAFKQSRDAITTAAAGTGHADIFAKHDAGLSDNQNQPASEEDQPLDGDGVKVPIATSGDSSRGKSPLREGAALGATSIADEESGEDDAALEEDATIRRLREWLLGLGWQDCGLSVVRPPDRASMLEVATEEKGASLERGASEKEAAKETTDGSAAMEAFGYGAVAQRPVGKGVVVVDVPVKAFMSYETALSCPAVGPLCRQTELTPWQGLILHLLVEGAKGEASYWAPYLAVLPSLEGLREQHPLLWTEEMAVRWLAGSPMLARLLNRWQQCREDTAALVKSGANGLLPPGTKRETDLVTEETVRWAAAILLSRSFSLDLTGETGPFEEGSQEDEGDQEGGDRSDDDDGEEDEEMAIGESSLSVVLVPWADLLNHSSAAGQESCLLFDPCTQTAMLSAHQEYGAGQQVLDSYGPSLAPADLLLDYGFVDTANANDSVQLPASLIGADVAAPNRSLLEAIGLPPESSLFTLSSSGVDETVMAWTRAAVATLEELRAAGYAPPGSRGRSGGKKKKKVKGDEALGGARGAAMAMARFVTPVGGANEEKALQQLLLACQGLLEAYPTTIDDDKAVLKGGGDRPSSDHEAGGPQHHAVVHASPSNAVQQPAVGASAPLQWLEQQVRRAVLSEKLAIRGAQLWLFKKLKTLRAGTPVDRLYSEVNSL